MERSRDLGRRRRQKKRKERRGVGPRDQGTKGPREGAYSVGGGGEEEEEDEEMEEEGGWRGRDGVLP